MMSTQLILTCHGKHLDECLGCTLNQGLSQDQSCLLDRQFPENLLFGQAKTSIRTFSGNNQIFS